MVVHMVWKHNWSAKISQSLVTSAYMKLCQGSCCLEHMAEGLQGGQSIHSKYVGKEILLGA